MLDLLISYINFIILTISLIVKKFTFYPPKPPQYIIKKNKGESDEIIFLVDGKQFQPQFSQLNFNFYLLSNYLPILVFIPNFKNDICIIYSHGNSGDLGSCLKEYVDISLNTNCTLVTYEYPGYGFCKNQKVSESEFVKNLKIVYKFIVENLEFSSEQIILYGFSLGTGVSFDLACDNNFPVLGLILQAPYLSIIRILYSIGHTKYFDLFNTCDKAKLLKTKTLFIHGNKDYMIPYIHGRILAKIIPQEYFYNFITIDNAGHNNILKLYKDLLFNSINQFINDLINNNNSEIFNNNDNNKSSNESSENFPLDFFCDTQKANANKNFKSNKSNILKFPEINKINSRYSFINNETNYITQNNCQIKNYYYSNVIFKSVQIHNSTLINYKSHIQVFKSCPEMKKNKNNKMDNINSK